MEGKKKMRKVIIGISACIIALVLLGGFLWSFHFRWVSLADSVPPAIWNEGDTTVTIDMRGIYEVVFMIDEPAVYIGNERLVLRDGVRIRNGRAYATNRDLVAINGYEIKTPLYDGDLAIIVNGMYGRGSLEENEMIHSLLGGADARRRFELYFQWYNTVHELGHLITFHNGTYIPSNTDSSMEMRHMVEEEILVNSFAVAFWMHSGEIEKIEALEEVVEYVLSNITPPVENMPATDFMREVVDGERDAPFTFEVYGWFQFSLVRDILRERDSLDLTAILAEMTGRHIDIEQVQTLVYPTLGIDMVAEILADVVSILREWGGIFTK